MIALMKGILLFLSPLIADACAVVMVGKDASETGLPIVTHSYDGPDKTTDVRMTRTPGRSWPEGSVRPLYDWQDGYPRIVSSVLSPSYLPVGEQQESVPLAHIPQVEQTYAYWDANYGTQNEHGLSMGESTCRARTTGSAATPGNSKGYSHASIRDLTRIGMERCKTARCAIQTMGAVAVEQGFYGEGEFTSECVAVADAVPGDVWTFCVMAGKHNRSAIWAAQRVPEDHVTSIDNDMTIRRMDLQDKSTFMYSPGVTDLAVEMGWWKPHEHDSNTFDFLGSYGRMVDFMYPHRRIDPYLKKRQDSFFSFYSGRRMWRVWNLLTPEEGATLDPNTGHLPNTKNPYPFSLPARHKSVTLPMVKNLLRDHFEGTPYDLTKGMAAGPFGNPNRGDYVHADSGKPVLGYFERAMSIHRCVYSYICHLRPDGKSLLWMGWAVPHATAYLPLYAAGEEAPESFISIDGQMSKFSTKVAWWAFAFVTQYEELNFKLMNAEVQQHAAKVEAEAMKKLQYWESSGVSVKDLQLLCNSMIEIEIKYWWELAISLVTKYGRYVTTYNETAIGQKQQTYPEWWANSPEVGYSSWTPSGPNWGHQVHQSNQSRVVGRFEFWAALMIATVCILSFSAGRHTRPM